MASDGIEIAALGRPFTLGMLYDARKDAVIQDATDLTLDPNTAHRSITLSRENKMASYGTTQSYPDHPERFTQHQQVLCKEGLSERHYWEVEWRVDMFGDPISFVGAFAAYKGISRTHEKESYVFSNPKAWCFAIFKLTLIAFAVVSNGNKVTNCTAHTKKMGFYLDWPAGTLSLYDVFPDSLSHIHTFHSRFTEPLYPGVLTQHSSSVVSLCPFD